MTIEEFNALSIEDQAAVAMQGDFVDVRQEKNWKVALYHLPFFYAEVYYDGEANQVVRTRAFTAASELAPYVHLN